MLQLQEVPDPVAGPNEVLIDVVSAGVNYADALAVQGFYATAPAPPWVPGHEVAGYEVGTSRPVMAYVPSRGYSSRVVAQRDFVFSAEGLNLGEAGGYVLVTLAALYSLREAAGLRKGESILITAAAGGLGSTAIHVARLLGASRVIGLASTPEKRAFAISQGADAALGYGDPLPEVDLLFDSVGADEGFERRFDAIRHLGRAVLMGASCGREPPVPSFADLRRRNVGVFVYSWGMMRRYATDRIFATVGEAITLIHSGRVRPVVRHSMPLEDAGQAHRLLTGRLTMGKVVLHV